MAPRSSSDRAHGTLLERSALVALGVYLFAVGLHAVGAGRLIYLNYLRWPVAAPLAITIGLIVIVAGLLRWR